MERQASAMSNRSFLLSVRIDERARGVDCLPKIGITDGTVDHEIDRPAEQLLEPFSQPEIVVK